MAIYLCKKNSPVFRRAVVWGKTGVFPQEIPPADLQYLLKPVLWSSGRSPAATLLHQAVRAAGYKHMASIPIGQSGAWSGILATAGNAYPTSKENVRSLLQMLSTAASFHLQQHIQHSNFEAKLREMRSGLVINKTIQDAISEGVLLVSPNNEILQANSAVEDILGYTEHEIYKQPIENVLIGSERIIPALKLAWQGIPTLDLGKVRLHRRDGSSFAASIQTAPVKQNNKILGVLFIFQDISEHERTKIRTQQLEQRALLGEVTAVFAHEVRNPINNISTGLQLMALNTPKEDTETHEMIQRLLGDCTRLTNLMESVLTFSRTGNYNFAPLDLGSLLERLLKRWRPRMERLGIQYHIKIAPDTLPVRGDQRSLDQVFTNLISNAVRVMGKQGGTLAVKIGPHFSSGGKAFTQVDISDTGPGIPEEMRKQIFEPFFTTSPNGTGLGLSITKEIVTAHRGRIDLTSFPGGTIFHIYLPVINTTEEIKL